ncbi:MAG: hypothetical protein HRF49_03240 [bacterium]|jgi:hypothetical protein
MIDNPLDVIPRVAGHPAIERSLVSYFTAKHEAGVPIALVDDPQNPRVLFGHLGGWCRLAASDPSVWPSVMEDLFRERVEQSPPWPDPALVHDWENPRNDGETSNGERGLFLDQAPLPAWEAAIAAGFQATGDEEDNRNTAHIWAITGEPRFAHLVKHPCRLGKGHELKELLMQGIHYDEKGEYTARCLDAGPSFVCEVDGLPVCWSCTHLSGAMGMIYTPEEHRRKGYARSLAAFQIDTMLAMHGIAFCHILDWNTASQELVKGFGAEPNDEPLVWRGVAWPK